MSTTTSGSESSVSADQRIITDEPEVGGDTGKATDDAGTAQPRTAKVGRFSWKRSVAYGLLPGLALSLAVSAGYLKWQCDSARQSDSARVDSVQAAAHSAVTLLSYRPGSVEKDLTAARDRLSGAFREDYTKLINDVVIPGAKEKHISAVANVPAVAWVSATENHAVVLVFVNQSVTVGDDPPSSMASSVRVTLERIDDRWLISAFDPV
jgi:Mce-associated membrane protein